jgi:hypothetical protein
MPRIRCHYLDCGFLDDGFCSAAAIEVDPDTGCRTYSPQAESTNDDEWDEEEELEEWEELEDEEEEDDEIWLDEEEDEY